MPDQLLELNFDTLNAVIKGYEDRLFDQQLLEVHGGFWTGYYIGAKRPKPLKTIIEKMLNQKNKPTTKHSDSIDVEAFKSMEEQFKHRQRLLERSENNGRRKGNTKG
jgi:hypothetical protein